MSPHERDHPASGPRRPGGGTYPVRAAVSPTPAEPAPAERVGRTHERPLVPYKHASPRNLLTVILLGFALVTALLVAFSVSGYLPGGDHSMEPDSAPAPTDGGAPE